VTVRSVGVSGSRKTQESPWSPERTRPRVQTDARFHERHCGTKRPQPRLHFERRGKCVGTGAAVQPGTAALEREERCRVPSRRHPGHETGFGQFLAAPVKTFSVVACGGSGASDCCAETFGPSIAMTRTKLQPAVRDTSHRPRTVSVIPAYLDASFLLGASARK
jgi:hypothetical protein